MYDNSRNNNGYGSSGGGRYQTSHATPEPIKPAELPSNYIDKAEEYMQNHSKKISASKIRRIYSLFTEIYNAERLRTDEKLTSDSIYAIGMMRVRIAYEAGRDPDVKKFVQDAKLLNYIKGVKNDRSAFIRLTEYMESLVAYHKFYKGEEN